MKKQLIELAEEDIEKAKPVGRPKIIEVEHSATTLFNFNTLYKITQKVPRGADAFSKSKREDISPGSTYWYFAVQYYKLK